MLDGSNIPKYRVIACGHQHEEGFDIKNIDATIEKVRNCPMRGKGSNILCAHTDIFPDEQDIFSELKKIAHNLENQDVLDIITFIRGVNQQLDNLKRSSHIHGSYGRNERILPDSDFWSQTRKYLDELNKILDQSIGNNRNLNAGERTRFDFLVIQTQLRSKEILDGILPKLT